MARTEKEAFSGKANLPIPGTGPRAGPICCLGENYPDPNRKRKCTSNNPERSPCPAGDGKCRGDLDNIWSVGIGVSDNILDGSALKLRSTPVQTGGDLSDIAGLMLADPMMVYDKQHDIWYLFTEVLNNRCQKGEIGLSISRDGLRSFEYQRVVISESWHLSWPFTVSHGGTHYMITCATAGAPADLGLWLYESPNNGSWPYRWYRKKKIITGAESIRKFDSQIIDPVLFYQKSDMTWYLFAMTGTGRNELLYFADDITGEFTEHPLSGSYKGVDETRYIPGHRDRKIGEVRQAGRIVVDEDAPGKPMFAFFQDGGMYVYARQLQKLSRTAYAYGDERIQVLSYQTDLYWANWGMHTFNAYRVGVRNWVIAVDGKWKDSTYSTWHCLHQTQTLGESSQCAAKGQPHFGAQPITVKSGAMSPMFAFN